LLYHVNPISLPFNYHLGVKTEVYTDPKTNQKKRRAPQTKKQIYQQLLAQANQNKITFRYVVNNVWFASADNMMFVKHDLKRDFVMPLKTNRKIALSIEAKKQGRYVRVDELLLEADTTLTVYLEGVDFAL